MAKYHSKPLKKAGVVLAILVLGLLILAWFSGTVLIPKNKTAEIVRLPDQNTAKAIDLDSDHDGLKDWEETIYHTDPNNPDTDGDGISDGDEISQGHDPLKKGPDDKLVVTTEQQQDSTSDAYLRLKSLADQGNITQALIYQVIGKSGLSAFLNPAQSKNTVADLEQYLSTIKPAPKFSEDAIPDDSLAITSDTSTNAIKTYFNSVARIYEQYIFPIKDDDISIVRAALETTSTEKLGELSALVGATEKTYEEIKKMSVPKNELLFHKKELFYLQNTKEEITLMQSSSLEDTLYLALLTNMSIEMKKGISELHHTEIPVWLEHNGIVFSTSEKALLIYSKN